MHTAPREIQKSSFLAYLHLTEANIDCFYYIATMNLVRLTNDVENFLELVTGYIGSRQALTNATALREMVKRYSLTKTLTTDKIAFIQTQLIPHALVEEQIEACEAITYQNLENRRNIVALRELHPNNKRLLSGWVWGVRALPADTQLLVVSRLFVDTLDHYVRDFKDNTIRLLRACSDIKSLMKDANFRLQNHPRHYATPDRQRIMDQAGRAVELNVEELKGRIEGHLATYRLTVNEQITLIQHLAELVGLGWGAVHFHDCNWLTSLAEGADQIASEVENLYVKSHPRGEVGCMMGWSTRVVVNRLRWSVSPFDQDVLGFATKLKLSKRSSVSSLSPAEFLYILKKYRLLRKVDVSGAILLNNSAFQNGDRFPLLERLRLSAVGDIGKALEGFPTLFPNLKKLDVSNNTWLTPDHLRGLIKMTSLRILRIEYCTQISGEVVDELRGERQELNIRSHIHRYECDLSEWEL